MKKGVILLVLLVLLIPVSFAKEVAIKDIFKVKEGVVEPSSEEKSLGDITTYFYAGSKLLASKNGELRYHYQDRMGSEIDGKQLPFGQEIKESENRFSFTGKEEDSDLYYFNARYYDSNLGKFTSVDPVTSELSYGYVSNNPMNMVDPTGMAGDLVGKGTLVIPSAEGWGSVNIYSLATYAVNNGYDNFDIPAGFWTGAGGSRVSALVNYYVGFNRREGGADPNSLNSGDVLYVPITAGRSFNPGDVLAFTSARADSLGLGSGVTTDVADTQTLGGPSTYDLISSATMGGLNDPRWSRSRTQAWLKKDLMGQGFAERDIDAAWARMASEGLVGLGYTRLEVLDMNWATSETSFKGGKLSITARDTVAWFDYVPRDTTIATYTFLGITYAKQDTFITPGTEGGPQIKPRTRLSPFAPTSADSASARLYFNQNYNPNWGQE
jgi:RHS repeat-associated protein